MLTVLKLVHLAITKLHTGQLEVLQPVEPYIHLKGVVELSLQVIIYLILVHLLVTSAQEQDRYNQIVSVV